jgi:hypothetical protein
VILAVGDGGGGVEGVVGDLQYEWLRLLGTLVLVLGGVEETCGMSGEGCWGVGDEWGGLEGTVVVVLRGLSGTGGMGGWGWWGRWWWWLGLGRLEAWAQRVVRGRWWWYGEGCRGLEAGVGRARMDFEYEYGRLERIVGLVLGGGGSEETEYEYGGLWY